jgi:hypothetical protein
METKIDHADIPGNQKDRRETLSRGVLETLEGKEESSESKHSSSIQTLEQRFRFGAAFTGGSFHNSP